MNYKRLSKVTSSIVASSILLAIGGCATIIRENIISSIESGTGISIS
jgi:hypothetical protein